LLKEHCVIDEIKEEIKRSLEVNENENMTYQTLWDTAKAVLSGEFVAMSTYIKKTERSQITHLMLHLKVFKTQIKQERIKKNKGQN
jgi:hypothetical protein